MKQLNDLYLKTSAGNTRPIAASDSSVAQTRPYPFNTLEVAKAQKKDH